MINRIFLALAIFSLFYSCSDDSGGDGGKIKGLNVYCANWAMATFVDIKAEGLLKRKKYFFSEKETLTEFERILNGLKPDNQDSEVLDLRFLVDVLYEGGNQKRLMCSTGYCSFDGKRYLFSSALVKMFRGAIPDECMPDHLQDLLKNNDPDTLRPEACVNMLLEWGFDRKGQQVPILEKWAQRGLNGSIFGLDIVLGAMNKQIPEVGKRVFASGLINSKFMAI